MPTSAEDLWDALARSRLLAPEEVEGLRRRWAAETADAGDPGSLVRWLVAGQYVTEYQAALLARGQGGPFFFGPYKVLDLAGTGRAAVVYRAMHRLGRVVAVKALPPSAAGDRRLRARFRRQAALALRLDHPHVVRALQAGDEGRLPYLVLEYLEGQTLAEVLNSRRLAPDEAAGLVAQAFLAQQYLHEHGATPRGLVPADLMVVPAAAGAGLPTVKLVGMGLGRPLSTEALLQGDAPAATAYLAPEQAWGPRAVDVRADVYALGCVLYHALTGRPPFPGTSALLQAVRHATEPARPARELNPAVPDGLQQILDWMMAKEPSQRYQTPGRAAQALLAFLLSREEVVPGGMPSLPLLAEAPAPAREEGSPNEAVRTDAPGPLPTPLLPVSRRQSFSRRDCLALVIGAGGLLCTQAAGWLLARHLRRGPRAGTDTGSR